MGERAGHGRWPRPLSRPCYHREGLALSSPSRCLARVGRGERFAAAFRAETGQSLGEFETACWQRRTLFDRWLPVISSSVVLWGGIALLALAAFRRRRRRDAERLRRWDEEEAAAPAPPSADGEPDER